MSGKLNVARLSQWLGKYKFVALILCLGVVLMLLPTRGARGEGGDGPDGPGGGRADL